MTLLILLFMLGFILPLTLAYGLSTFSNLQNGLGYFGVNGIWFGILALHFIYIKAIADYTTVKT